MTKLTAMVSLYNSGDWIENRLKNLLESSIASETEIWCLNANSPDERDHEIPTRLAKTNSTIRYEKLPERNTVYEAWNYIISNSDSEFVTNANTDDLVMPNCYSTLIKSIQNTDHALAYCSWYTTSKPNQSCDNLTEASSDGRPGHYAGIIEEAGVGHFPLWKRSLHSELGLFDTSYQALADAEWWARIHYVGKKKLLWVDQNLGVYLWRDGNNLWNRAISEQEWQKYHEKIAEYKSA